VFDAVTGADLPPSGAGGPAHSVAADPAGKWLAVGGTDAVIRLFDLAKPGSAPRSLEATRPPIGALAFSADGAVLAHASPADGLVWLWDPATGDPTLVVIEAADGCTLEGVAVSPDGAKVAAGGVDYLSTGDRDGAVCVWDVATKDKIRTFDLGVTAVAFDPSGRFLAGAGLTNRVYLWDLAADGADPVLTLDGHTDRVNAVVFSPDGSYLLTGGDDLTVRVWDVLSGRPVIARVFDSAVRSLAFAPDGGSVFTGNGNTTCYQVPFQKLLDE
jgi:WD40 repeat protein